MRWHSMPGSVTVTTGLIAELFLDNWTTLVVLTLPGTTCHFQAMKWTIPKSVSISNMHAISSCPSFNLPVTLPLLWPGVIPARQPGSMPAFSMLWTSQKVKKESKNKIMKNSSILFLVLISYWSSCSRISPKTICNTPALILYLPISMPGPGSHFAFCRQWIPGTRSHCHQQSWL